MIKFEIPDEMLESVGIDPKKLSPEQLKAIFAQLAEKGVLKPNKKGASSEGSHAGLVKKKIQVTRGGKTFTEERWVKPGEDEPTDKPPKAKPEKKELVIRGLNKSEGKDGEKKDDPDKEDKTSEEKPEEPKEKPKEPEPKEEAKPESKKEEPKEEAKPEAKPDKDVKAPKKESKPEKKPDDVVSKLKPGMTVNVMGKDKVVKEIDQDNELVVCEDGSGFSFGAVNKFGEIKEAGAEKKLESPKEKPKPFNMSKDNLSKLHDGEEMGLPPSAHESNIHVAEYKDGNKAIYKVTDSLDDAVGELGYHDLAKEVGWDMVPQTEHHLLAGDEEGTCQAFVEGKEPLDKYHGGEVKITEKHFNDIAQIFVLDGIVGNTDRHLQNVKVNEDGRVWAIDNDTWTENSHTGDKFATLDEKLDCLSRYADDKLPPYKNKVFDWLTQSLSAEDFKKFQGVVNEKLTELMKHKDKVCGFYEMEEWGKVKHPDKIENNLKLAEKYLSEQK